MKTFLEFITESIDFKTAMQVVQKEVESTFEDKSKYKEPTGSAPKTFPNVIVDSKKTRNSLMYSISASSYKERPNKNKVEAMVRKIASTLKMSSAGLNLKDGYFESERFDIFWKIIRGSSSDVSFIKDNKLKSQDFELFVIEVEEK